MRAKLGELPVALFQTLCGLTVLRNMPRLENDQVLTINANWPITFEFTDGNVYIVNYEDYH